MAGIHVDGVRKNFDDFVALEDVSLDVRDQEFTVLLGPSGCGKTTLLRIIAGLESENGGEISIGGRRVNGLPPRARDIAMVFQNYAVFPHMTVFENIAFGLRMKKRSDEVVKEKVEWAAELMHIASQLEKYSGQLSGGQRQRVAVARALAVEPQVLLMDEPLSNLDALLRLQMRAELKGLLQQSRTTTIYVTHDQVEAMSLADRIAVMHGGKIVQYDVPIRVYQDPASAFCGGFIGNPPMNFLPGSSVGEGRYKVADAVIDGPVGEPPDLTFGIRPEDLALAEPGPGVISGKVGVVEPLGPHQLLTLLFGDHPFRVTVPSDTPIHSGDAIHMRPAPERMRWFDSESGEAIGR